MKIVFLDIEETIVDSIDGLIAIPKNIIKIKKILQSESPDKIETFSFGLWESVDFANWKILKQWMQEEHGITVETQKFATKQFKMDFLKSITGWAKIEEKDFFDFMQLSNKELTFEWFIKKNFTEGTFILIDDMVPNKTIKQDDLIIQMKNIKDC